MPKIKDATEANALHDELCCAISDLAKSVEFAVKRKALRDEIATTMTGATKVAKAAAELRAAANLTESSGQNPASLKFQAPTTQTEAQNTWTRATLVPNAATTDADVKDTFTRAALNPDVVDEREPGKHGIATSILELYDRFGSFTAKR